MGAVLNLKVLVKKGLLGIHFLKGSNLPKREPTLFLGFRVCISNNYRRWNYNVVMSIEQLPWNCKGVMSTCVRHVKKDCGLVGVAGTHFLALRNRIDGVQRHLAS